MTTSYSDTELVAARLHEAEDRGQVLSNLRERKLANTGTNIVFGFNDVKYESDAMMRGRDALGAPPFKNKRAEQKAMKAALTATNFVLGADAVDYETEASVAVSDTTGVTHLYRGVLQKDVQNFIKKSSIFIGSDGDPGYTTTMRDGLPPRELSKDGGSMRDEAKKLKRELGTHNFALGDAKLAYTTEQTDQFLWDRESAKRAQGVMRAAVKKDLQSHHFEHGHASLDYDTVARQSQRCGEITKERVAEMKSDKTQAEDLKQMLLKTMVCIGSDDEYM